MFDLEYVRYGFIQGDGCLGRLDSDNHLGLEINIGFNDKDIFTLFNIDFEEGKRSYYTTGYNVILRKLGFCSNQLPTRILPITINSWSDRQRISFLRGLYSANGSIINAKNDCARITFKTTCKELTLQLTEALQKLDFHPYTTTNKAKLVAFSNGDYICKESYDVNIGRRSECVRFYNEIGFVHDYKTEKLERCLGLDKLHQQSQNNFPHTY